MARDFLGSLYDLFVENRGLVMTLLAADALSESELAEAGIRHIGRALAVIGRIGSKGIDRKGLHSQHAELAARSTVAMVAAWLRSARPSSAADLPHATRSSKS